MALQLAFGWSCRYSRTSSRTSSRRSICRSNSGLAAAAVGSILGPDHRTNPSEPSARRSRSESRASTSGTAPASSEMPTRRRRSRGCNRPRRRSRSNCAAGIPPTVHDGAPAAAAARASSGCSGSAHRRQQPVERHGLAGWPLRKVRRVRPCGARHEVARVGVGAVRVGVGVHELQQVAVVSGLGLGSVHRLVPSVVRPEVRPS